ncbi:hypothetical protein ACQQ2Q_04100 [Agrobacterium sp. ES01]|uniref:hypothetical protein n=1 Tax=Agrobacterium sp. ES01 TaxID=3420714 RepID=UPI003D0DF9E9
MSRWNALPIAAILSLAAAMPAAAASRFYCAIDDAALKLSLESNFTDGSGRRLNHFRGKLRIKGDKVPGLFQDLTLNTPMLTQTWVDEKSLRLRFYYVTERQFPYAAIDMIVNTEVVPGETARFQGKYYIAAEAVDPKSEKTEEVIRTQGQVGCEYK